MVIGRLLRPRFISVLLDITYSKSNIYLMSVLDTMLGVDRLSRIFTTTFRCGYYPQFTDKVIEAHTDELT